MDFKEKKRRELEQYLYEQDESQERDRMAFIKAAEEQRQKLLQQFGQNGQIVIDLINKVTDKCINSMNKMANDGKEFRRNMLQSF